MRYLLDTNIVSYLYDPQSPHHSKIKPHIQEGHSYYLSILTLFEMEYSLANTPESKNSRVSNSIANMPHGKPRLPKRRPTWSKPSLKKSRNELNMNGCGLCSKKQELIRNKRWGSAFIALRRVHVTCSRYEYLNLDVS